MAAASGLKRAARRERRRRFGYVLYRWFLVLVGSVGVAWLVHGILARGAGVPIELPTTGIAIAAACAFAGDLMSLLTACGVYIRGEAPGPGHMVSGFWKAWGTATTLFLAFFSYVVPVSGATHGATAATQETRGLVAPPSAQPADTPPRLGEPWLVVYSTQPPPADPRPRLSTVPVFFRRNAAIEMAAAKSNPVPGVSFVEDELDVSTDGLRRIVAALAACGAVPGGPPTELEVAGFASSLEVAAPQGAGPGAMDPLEARIANRRARAAYCYIGSLTPVRLTNSQDWEGYEDGPECALDKAPAYRPDAPPVQITVRRWEEGPAGWQHMMAARRFVDRPPGVAQVIYSDPEELNRRVDIGVLSAGSCSSAAAPRPAVAPPAVAPAVAPTDGSGRIAQTDASEPGEVAPGG